MTIYLHIMKVQQHIYKYYTINYYFIGLLWLFYLLLFDENLLLFGIMSSETKENASSDSINVFTGMNCASFTWNMTDKSLIKQILNASNGELFQSKSFIMTKLPWKLQLHPNGIDKKRKGIVTISLLLLSCPTALHEMAISRMFR